MRSDMPLERANAFCARFRLRVPVLLAPMAGVPATKLSIAVANAGGMGACGALTMSPHEIEDWSAAVRAATTGPFQLNLWIPDPPPRRDEAREAAVRDFLAPWSPPPSAQRSPPALPDFAEQCRALLTITPAVVSSVMGLYPPMFVNELKSRGIAWFATVSTVAEARAAVAAGADAIIAQGAEAGGHRGAFDASAAEQALVGLFSLLPAVVDAVDVPVVATGGIADGRGVAAALLLGASAVQIGTGFLRSPEAGIHPAWAAALAETMPEQTRVSRVFSGRAGRSIATEYVRAATAVDAPPPAPYPIQRALTSAMRAEAVRRGDVQRMQAWAGQSAALALPLPADEILTILWRDARALLDSSRTPASE